MKSIDKTQSQYASGKKMAQRGSKHTGLTTLLMVLMALFAACSPKNLQERDNEQQYTCPMHPEIVENQPGACPICGMDLVPMHAHDDSTAVSDGLKPLLQPVNSSVLSDIKTIHPVKKQLNVPLRLNGLIQYDSRRENNIAVRFAGRIEKLYIHYNFEKVKKGQKLMEIYSPELVTAQNELLYLLQNDVGNQPLINASKQKLQLLGLSHSQIEKLVKRQKAFYSLAVYSPFSGYVYEKPAAIPEALPAAQGMDGSENMSGTGESLSFMPEQEQLSIREGMYLSKGEAVFSVINTDKVLAEFTAYPQQVPYLQKGNPILVYTNDSVTINAKIDLIQPFFQEGGNFSKIRVYLNNSNGDLRPGQLVEAEMKITGDSTWCLPNTAITDIGTQKVVFVKDGTIFHPKTIQIGRVTETWTEVLSGIDPRASIAVNAHFMVDSEGFVDMR